MKRSGKDGNVMKKKKWAVLGALVAAGVLVVILAVRLAGITEAQKAEAYLKNCIMVGDSVTVGFQNYCAKSDQDMWKQLRFLASVSLSAHNALWPVSEKSIHPLYQGEQRPVWESISMMGAKDVFISLGLNDLNIADDTCVYYQELADKIQTWSPGTRIHVISVTYVLKEGEKNEVRNVNIQELNEKLKVLAESEEAGVFLAISRDGRQIFVQGHPEYDRVTLHNEYMRDLNRGLDIHLPFNYYPADDCTKKPMMEWRSHCNTLYSNWLNYYVYQNTPYLLDEIGFKTMEECTIEENE